MEETMRKKSKCTICTSAGVIGGEIEETCQLLTRRLLAKRDELANAMGKEGLM